MKYLISMFLFFNILLSYSQNPPIKKFQNFESFLEYQQEKLNRIALDMTISKVSQVMGGPIVVKIPNIDKKGVFKELFKQPEHREIVRRAQKKPLLVYWFFQQPKNFDGVISKEECLPVIFENKKVVGIGTENYKKLIVSLNKKNDEI